MKGNSRVAIEVRNIVKKFGAFAALDGVDLKVADGELLALLGPSGSGKTTLLRIIAGLDWPDAGEVSFDGENALARGAGERHVGFVFQHYALFRHMTVFENVAFGLRVQPRSVRKNEASIRTRVRELLDLVQLDWLSDRYPSQLSGGQRQRIALARALAIEPRVLLLDEPFGALDAQVRKELRTWLRRLHDEVHVTTVFVTHDQEEAMDVADRIFVMAGGVVEQEGTPDELYERPANDFVMSFLGPVTKLNGTLVRPHDLDLCTTEEPGSVHARVVRIARLGFEVRVEVEIDSDDGQVDSWIQVTREEAAKLGIKAGDEVFVRKADKERISATAVPA
jgi:sulfate/thiosulfate transport system ATP-binding protein